MESYEQIVTRWYSKLHDPFVNLIRAKFCGLFLEDIEDIYQDTFLAVHENLQKGTVAVDTNWQAYIMKIGLNQTVTYCKQKGKIIVQPSNDDENDDPDWLSKMTPMEDLANEMTDDAKDRERMIAVMNGVMGQLKGKCKDLLPDFYYARMSMEEICQALGFANTDSAKTQRLKCFKKLQEAVQARLKAMGLL